MATIREMSFIMRIITSLIIAIIASTSESNAEEQWKEYYEDSSSTYFYDTETLHHPYKDNQNIIAVWTKTIPSRYITHNRERIGYLSDLIYINCEKNKYRRTEMLIQSHSGEIINRQKGIKTYYTIDPESEAEALFQKVCP